MSQVLAAGTKAPGLNLHVTPDQMLSLDELKGRAVVYGLFWEMHDSVYASQANLSVPLLFALARELGLSDARLEEALTQETYASKVRSDFLSGVRSGVNGTPSFFINGRRHDGSYAFDELYSAIEASGSPRGRENFVLLE